MAEPILSEIEIAALCGGKNARHRIAVNPVWTDDALSRLLGACDGYIHAMLKVQNTIGRFDSAYFGRFDPRHIRKIAQRDAITKPLRELAASLEIDLRKCQATYRVEYERAHPRAHGGSETWCFYRMLPQRS